MKKVLTRMTSLVTAMACCAIVASLCGCAKSPKNVVMDYLAAVTRSDAGEADSFLVKGYKADMIGEFKANAALGWVYSSDDTKIISANESTVVVDMVFKGGTTGMVTKRTFSLQNDNGVWKIGAMNPPPATRGPGVTPL